MFFWHSVVDVADSPRTTGEGKYRNIKTSCGSYLIIIIHCENMTTLNLYQRTVNCIECFTGDFYFLGDFILLLGYYEKILLRSRKITDKDFLRCLV